MYKHILITTDGSDFSLQGVDHGLALAAATGAKVTVLTVTQPFPLLVGIMGEASYASAEMMQDYDRSQKEMAGELLDKMAKRAAQKGVTADTRHIADAQAADAIIQSAQALGCDLICMASHGRRGLKRLLLGSQAAEVVAHAAVPVLIVR